MSVTSTSKSIWNGGDYKSVVSKFDERRDSVEEGVVKYRRVKTGVDKKNSLVSIYL